MTSLPALEQLFGVYLNLDWIDDYADPWRAIEEFATSEPIDAARLPGEVASLLRGSPSESSLRHRILDELGSGYDPDADGWTYEAWLREVVKRVEAYG